MCNCSGFQFCEDCARSSECTSGIPGLDGLDGKTIISGESDPANFTGNDGDFYIRRQSPFRFFYKEAGVWSYLGDLKGVDGNGFFIEKSLTISSTEISTLNTSPVELLPNLASGYAYNIIEAIAITTATATPWVVPGPFYLRYKTAASDYICGFANLLGSGSKVIKSGDFYTSTSKLIIDTVGVEVFQSISNPTSTGGPLTIKVSYHIWSV
jgi:hypothetical protein